MKREDFVSLALSYEGYPSVFVRGARDRGCTPEGFDCSGFVNFLLQEAGFPEAVPRHSNKLFDYFGVTVDTSCRLPGDIVFFSRNGIFPQHVGIMIAEDSYIHAPGKNNTVVCVKKLEKKLITSSATTNRFYRTNPIGFKRIMVRGENRYQKPFLS